MLAERWTGLMAAIGGRDEGGAVYKAVTAAYGGGGRFYHGLEHLRRCLAELDGATPAGRPAVLEFAAWLHDLVCEPGSTANETVSAAAAECFARRLGASPAFAARAAALIVATRHDRPPADADMAVLLDADLAVLADPWPAFAAYEAGIRREYAYVAAATYARQRRAFVRSLLAKASIYHSEYFRRRGEAAARRNLGRLLALL